jgi:hypothetical protein
MNRLTSLQKNQVLLAKQPSTRAKKPTMHSLLLLFLLLSLASYVYCGCTCRKHGCNGGEYKSRGCSQNGKDDYCCDRECRYNAAQITCGTSAGNTLYIIFMFILMKNKEFCQLRQKFLEIVFFLKKKTRKFNKFNIFLQLKLVYSTNLGCFQKSTRVVSTPAYKRTSNCRSTIVADTNTPCSDSGCSDCQLSPWSGWGLCSADVRFFCFCLRFVLLSLVFVFLSKMLLVFLFL